MRTGAAIGFIAITTVKLTDHWIPAFAGMTDSGNGRSGAPSLQAGAAGLALPDRRPSGPSGTGNDTQCATVGAANTRSEERGGHHCFRMYLFTARLWASRLSLNSLVPSPRETKYSAFVCAGCTAAISAALPGMAIGVGGRPARV